MLEDFFDVAQQLGDKLQQHDIFLATAESCTGGLVSAVLTSVSGSSKWFDRGFVTYCNDAKHDLLGVSHRTLAEHGAVSLATARAMAEGALQHSQANASVAITGVAGPLGGSLEKPVGTVCFGFAFDWQSTQVVQQQFSGTRTDIRKKSTQYAIEYLILIL